MERDTCVIHIVGHRVPPSIPALGVHGLQSTVLDPWSSIRGSFRVSGRPENAESRSHWANSLFLLLENMRRNGPGGRCTASMFVV